MLPKKRRAYHIWTNPERNLKKLKKIIIDIIERHAVKKLLT